MDNTSVLILAGFGFCAVIYVLGCIDSHRHRIKEIEKRIRKECEQKDEEKTHD
jgi:hypothetical protein